MLTDLSSVKTALDFFMFLWWHKWIWYRKVFFNNCRCWWQLKKEITAVFSLLSYLSVSFCCVASVHPQFLFELFKGKPDLNTSLPVRQTASIFKQPVTKVTNHPNNKVKSDPQKAVDQPRQVWVLLITMDEADSRMASYWSSDTVNVFRLCRTSFWMHLWHVCFFWKQQHVMTSELFLFYLPAADIYLCFCIQLFWEKKLSGLNAYDIAEELVKTMELPKGLQGIILGRFEKLK